MVIVGALVIVSACTSLVPSALDGSRSDGTITVGVGNVSVLDDVDWSGAQAIAVERCQAWGYSGAVAFGGVRQICGSRDCYTARIERKYQCTGG